MSKVKKDDFVTGWVKGVEAGKSVKEICEGLGMKEASARVRASLLRKQGVNLPYPSRNKKVAA